MSDMATRTTAGPAVAIATAQHVAPGRSSAFAT